jgi:hypothetical protein
MMITKAQDAQKRQPLDLETAVDTTKLRENTGLLRKIKARGAISRANADGWLRAETALADARANVAITAVNISEAQIRSALVGAAMPQIGALTTRLNAATAAVDQALSNGAAGEVYTHISNRAANVAFANDLLSTGKVSNEERDVIVSFSQADASDDILRSRERMKQAKTAVDSLHGCALEGIERAKEKLRS